MFYIRTGLSRACLLSLPKGGHGVSAPSAWSLVAPLRFKSSRASQSQVKSAPIKPSKATTPKDPAKQVPAKQAQATLVSLCAEGSKHGEFACRCFEHLPRPPRMYMPMLAFLARRRSEGEPKVPWSEVGFHRKITRGLYPGGKLKKFIVLAEEAGLVRSGGPIGDRWAMIAQDAKVDQGMICCSPF